MAGETDVRIVSAEADWSSGCLRDLVILCWRRIPTAERARRATRLVRDATTEHAATGVGIVIVVEETASTPDAAARALFAEVMRERSQSIRAVGYIVPAGGFGGAAIRAAITGLSLVARETYPTRVFASPDATLTWLSSRLESRWTVAEMTAAVERVRGA
jgi:hypothetical protein